MRLLIVRRRRALWRANLSCCNSKLRSRSTWRCVSPICGGHSVQRPQDWLPAADVEPSVERRAGSYDNPRAETPGRLEDSPPGILEDQSITGNRPRSTGCPCSINKDCGSPSDTFHPLKAKKITIGDYRVNPRQRNDVTQRASSSCVTIQASLRAHFARKASSSSIGSGAQNRNP